MKKTKIICTIGPSSSDKNTLIQLVKSGMNVARLNFSHGSYDEKKKQIDDLRAIQDELGTPVTIMADLQGPKLRLGTIDGIRQINAGETVILTQNASGKELPTQLDLSDVVEKNERVLLNDGLIELSVLKIEGDKIYTIAKNSGSVSSQKGINIPDSTYGKEVHTDKDKKDLAFALEQKVDFVALSFVRTGEDIKHIRSHISAAQSHCKILAKIEKKEAVDNLQEIIRESDGVLVARGDLAIETSPAEVPIIQLRMIGLARQLQKPIIIATQMLESMISNPRPTRAEASDVANAVLYQVDGVMLSAESASGKYPVETVQTMTDIIEKVESSQEFKHYIKINWESIEENTLKVSALAKTAASLSYRIQADCIAVATATGKTARVISSFRPNSSIIAVAHDEQVQNQLNLLWGVIPIMLKPTGDSVTFEKEIIKQIQKLQAADHNSKLVIVGGSRVGTPGMTDTIRVVTID